MTRRTRLIDEESTRNRVDNRLADSVRSPQRPCESGQGREVKGNIICEEAWSEFILISEYVFRTNPDAEIADVFEWFRIQDLGGQEYSPAVIRRATREVITDCGPWAA